MPLHYPGRCPGSRIPGSLGLRTTAKPSKAPLCLPFTKPNTDSGSCEFLSQEAEKHANSKSMKVCEIQALLYKHVRRPDAFAERILGTWNP